MAVNNRADAKWLPAPTGPQHPERYSHQRWHAARKIEYVDAGASQLQCCGVSHYSGEAVPWVNPI